MLVISLLFSFFFFNDTATTEIYTLSLHDALPILLWLPIGISIKDWEANSSRGWLRLPAQRDSNGSWLNFTQRIRSEEHMSELQSQFHLVCRLLLEKKKKKSKN